MLKGTVVRTLAVASLVFGVATPALGAAPFTGGPVIGKKKEAVVRLLEQSGWSYNASKSDHEFTYGDSFYTFENPRLHIDLVLDYNRKGVVTGGEVMPYMDAKSETYVNSHFNQIVRWFSGNRKANVEKKRADGHWASIKVH